MMKYVYVPMPIYLAKFVAKETSNRSVEEIMFKKKDKEYYDYLISLIDNLSIAPEFKGIRFVIPENHKIMSPNSNYEMPLCNQLKFIKFLKVKFNLKFDTWMKKGRDLKFKNTTICEMFMTYYKLDENDGRSHDALLRRAFRVNETIKEEFSQLVANIIEKK